MATKFQSLSREEWLKARGFSKDPFLPSSYRAETDILFSLPGFPTYVDRIDIKLLIGDFENPGYHFIFSQPGGGKSSLRKRIHFEYELRETTPNVLVVDYSDHSYPLTEIKVSDHIKRLIHLIEVILNRNLSIEKAFIDESPILALKKVIKVCNKLGILGIYVLVDELNLQTLQKVLPLAENIQFFNIYGLVFKFFIPNNLLGFAQSILPFSRFPPYVISWNKNDLSAVLNQRLITCLDSDYLVTPNVLPISFFLEEYQNLSVSVQSTFTWFGALADSPNLMWQFGNYLLEEHVNFERKNPSDSINRETYLHACVRLYEELLKNGRLTWNKAWNEARKDSELESSQLAKASTGQKPRAKVFLSYPEIDEKLVRGDLYPELQFLNYLPWMRSTNLHPGENRDAVIKSAIEESDFFIQCISSNLLNEDEYVQKELKWAMEIQNNIKEHEIFIIPVRLEECPLPINLKQWHVDWFIEEQRSKLFTALKEGKKRRRQKSKKMKPLIFLSYSRKDQDVVKAAYEELRKKGYSPWLDQNDILAGEKWERAIQRTIEKADFFLVFLSEHSVNRRGVLQKEIRMALDVWNGMLSDDIYLIPVRLTNCPIPEDLSAFQCVDLFEESGWSNLIKAITSGLKRRRNDPRNKG